MMSLARQQAQNTIKAALYWMGRLSRDLQTGDAPGAFMSGVYVVERLADLRVYLERLPDDEQADTLDWGAIYKDALQQAKNEIQAELDKGEI